MNFFADASKKNYIRVHPLLLSLTAAISASETNPDISTISENDERALRSNYYTPPDTLPPLEIHLSGQNGSSLLSTQNGLALTLVAGCRECVASAPQANLEEGGNTTQGNFAAVLYDLKKN